MYRTLTPREQMFAFENVCKAIRSKREHASELSEQEQKKLVGMIEHGKDVWHVMNEDHKDFAALRYSSHAGVRRAVHAVPELYELFQTYPSSHVVSQTTPLKFWIKCQDHMNQKVNYPHAVLVREDMHDDACAMWQELSEEQRSEVRVDYFQLHNFRHAIKEIPEVFEQFKQEQLAPLWQQVPRMRKDALVHLCLRDDYVLWSAEESEMIDFVGQHYELVLA